MRRWEKLESELGLPTGGITTVHFRLRSRPTQSLRLHGMGGRHQELHTTFGSRAKAKGFRNNPTADCSGYHYRRTLRRRLVPFDPLA